MANQWLRLWHDMPNDPKFRTVARVSKQRIGDVMSVYVHLLVAASINDPRGSIEGAREEDIASALDIETDSVSSIVAAMDGRLLDGLHLKGWVARQPVVETGATGARSTTVGENYVYFVESGNGRVVKIGVSKNPWSRLKDLQASSAETYRLVATIRTPQRNEYEVHEFFVATRVRGEWFSWSVALKTLIEKINAKEISDYEQCLSLLSSLPAETYEATTVATTDDIAATKDKDTDTDSSAKADGAKADLCPHQAIVDLYHETLPTARRIRDWTPARQQALRARWREKAERQDLTWWREFFGYVGKSDFLCGRTQSHNRKPFELSLDWLCKSENFIKVLEGAYEN